MEIDKFYKEVVKDLLRPWAVPTRLCLVGCVVFLGLIKIEWWRAVPAREQPPDWVYVWGSNAFLLFFVGACLSLAFPGGARIVPALLVIILLILGWLELALALMWLPFVMLELLHRVFTW